MLVESPDHQKSRVRAKHVLSDRLENVSLFCQGSVTYPGTLVLGAGMKESEYGVLATGGQRSWSRIAEPFFTVLMSDHN